jgi:hypothetical protein
MDQFDHIELKMGAMNCGMELSSFKRLSPFLPYAGPSGIDRIGF